MNKFLGELFSLLALETSSDHFLRDVWQSSNHILVELLEFTVALDNFRVKIAQ